MFCLKHLYFYAGDIRMIKKTSRQDANNKTQIEFGIDASNSNGDLLKTTNVLEQVQQGDH